MLLQPATNDLKSAEVYKQYVKLVFILRKTVWKAIQIPHYFNQKLSLFRTYIIRIWVEHFNLLIKTN